MNMQKLKSSQYMRFRLRRPAIPMRYGRWIDDVWISRGVNAQQQLELENVRTGHVLKLAGDQIHHFDTDPNYPYDGFEHGFLQLNVQVFLTDREIYTERLQRFPHPPRHRTGGHACA